MRKTYFYTLFALALASGNAGLASAAAMAEKEVAAQKLDKPALVRGNSEKQMPEEVRAFLATPAGRNFTAEQVMSVYGRKNPVAKAASDGVVYEAKIDEDFSLMTAGSEDAPDATDLNGLIDDYTKEKGWGAFLTYQAGGKAYLGFDEVGDDGPGYLMTPAVDLSEGDGVFKVSFRVKNVNPNATDQVLQYFIMDDDPDHKNIEAAASLPMTTEWTTQELFVDGGLKYTSVMFFGWRGKVLVDNVKVEKVTYPLSQPKNVVPTVTGGGEISATWDAVEGAAKYNVQLADADDDYKVVAEKTVDGTSAVLEASLDPTHTYAVFVVAENGEKTSYPGHGYANMTVSKVEAPVALDATNVTTSGFTANWEKSQYAANYKVSFVRTHTAEADGEELTYIDDDFSQIPYSANDPHGTVMTQDFKTPVSLDEMFNTPGWSTLLGIGMTGAFGITNAYEGYGIPGALFGPKSDFTVGGGKAHVTGVALTSVDDAQVKVGFAKLGMMNSITFNDGAQVFDVSASGSAFDVEVSGGSADSRLVFQIIDAAEGGDVVLFTNIKATATLNKGDRYTLPYSFATLPYDATSYTMEVPFTGDDKFEYTVSGSFGDTKSADSNTITVYSPEASAIGGVKTGAGAEAVYTTLDGVRVDNTAKSGVYIVKQGGKTFKVLK